MIKKSCMALCFFVLPLLSLPATEVEYGDTAIGIIYSADFGFISGPLSGLGLTGKIPGLPPLLGLNFWFGNKSSFIGLTGDWRLFVQPIYSAIGLNLCMGPGFFINYALSQTWNFNLGLRVPITMSWHPIRVLEAFFFELAPSVGIGFNQNSEQTVSPVWKVQGAVGCRVFF